MSASPIQKSTTVAFKHLSDGSPVELDLYLPAPKADTERLPTVVYFHGGGLHVGNKDFVPSWLIARVLSIGCAFISTNYQLIPPATGHDIIQDIKDLFTFLSKTEIRADTKVFKADMDRIAVAGSSSGGTCTYLAATNISPKPKALLSVYAPGGNLLIPQYITPKTEPFFMGQPLIDVSQYQDFLYPFPNGPLAPTSDVPMSLGGPPTSRRTAMAPIYLQLGIYLDYYTGLHGLTESLRKIVSDDSSTQLAELKAAIPGEHRSLFPQLAVDSSWPPTLLIHGTADAGVLAQETYDLYALLNEAEVDAELIKVADANHLFDFMPGAEEKYSEYFDQVKDFFAKHLL